MTTRKRSAVEKVTLLAPRIVTLGNLLKRRATLRYGRLLDLGRVQFGIVLVLGTCSPQSLGSLSNEMGLDTSQVSRAVSELVDRGIVRRKRSSSFHKEVVITLSEDGKKLADRMLKLARETNTRLTHGIPAADLKRFHEILGLLIERAHVLLFEEQG